jgi:hypothetical protein
LCHAEYAGWHPRPYTLSSVTRTRARRTSKNYPSTNSGA